MATTQEPLLPAPTTRSSTGFTILFFSLCMAAVVISLMSASNTLHRTATNTTTPMTSPSLCVTSPDPDSCSAIGSNALAAIQGKRPATHVHLLNHVITRSLDRLDVAVEAAGVAGEGVIPAVVDCVRLLDLSRDRLVISATAVVDGAHNDARTWLSAVLTNHDTCLDGLRDADPSQVPPELEAHIKELMAMTSAALAILSTTTATGDNEIYRPVREFPSWVTFGDRKLLETKPPSIAAARANVVVAKDGSGKFLSVQSAVDAAPASSRTRYVIYVKKGTYKENVLVRKKLKNIMLVGDGMDATIITGNRNVIDGDTTFNSGTLIAEGESFMLQDITVRNTAGRQKHQAVALRTSSDKTVVNRCRLDAYQDTLYTHTNRQFFRDSTVTGTVDFVFGNAAVVFQNCNLVARKPMRNQQNIVTAQGRTDPNQNTGISIQNCQVIPSSDLVPVKRWIPSYLGRPWKKYSRTVFMQSYIGNHIVPKGWLEWDGTFALKTLFYGEYANKGPGSGTAGRVKWEGYKAITKARDAMPFTVENLVQGGRWLPSTGVTFTEGL